MCLLSIGRHLKFKVGIPIAIRTDYVYLIMITNTTASMHFHDVYRTMITHMNVVNNDRTISDQS